MTNPQRLAFIQYQLEMIGGVLKIANEQNEEVQLNALFIEAARQLTELRKTVNFLQS
jgi:hypothetical protein